MLQVHGLPKRLFLQTRLLQMQSAEQDFQQNAQRRFLFRPAVRGPFQPAGRLLPDALSRRLLLLLPDALSRRLLLLLPDALSRRLLPFLPDGPDVLLLPFLPDGPDALLLLFQLLLPGVLLPLLLQDGLPRFFAPVRQLLLLFSADSSVWYRDADLPLQPRSYCSEDERS